MRFAATADQVTRQMEQWAKGKPYHLGGIDEGICVPDFSCCFPSLLQPIAVRAAYMAADEARRDEFRWAFYDAFMASEHATGITVHVVNMPPRKEPS